MILKILCTWNHIHFQLGDTSPFCSSQLKNNLCLKMYFFFPCVFFTHTERDTIVTRFNDRRFVDTSRHRINSCNDLLLVSRLSLFFSIPAASVIFLTLCFTWKLRINWSALELMYHEWNRWTCEIKGSQFDFYRYHVWLSSNYLCSSLFITSESSREHLALADC